MTTLNGIDVASHQAGIGKTTGDFRIIKTTESTNYTNPEMNSQIKSSPALKGFYHFASNGSVQGEADHFLAVVKPYIGKALLVLDYEPARPSVAWAKAWLDYVYAKTGVRPLIYLGVAVENDYDWSPVIKAGYGLWVAQYNNYSAVQGYAPRDLYGSLKHWPVMAMFQYTSSGYLPGWGKALDFDAFYGDANAWNKYGAVSGKITAAATVATPAVANHTTRTKPAVKVNVTYDMHQLNGSWLGEITNFSDDKVTGFAGNPNHAHDALVVKVSHGSVKYRVHTIEDGWLPFVTGYDRGNSATGFAGCMGHAIDQIEIFYITAPNEDYQQAWYRTQTTKRGGWLRVVCDDGRSVAGYTDTFAGEYGEPTDRLQIWVGTSNPF
ncbi:GH25 family lysozyme [Lacticaseibacillus sp. N501-2]|uniref:GH25 family lysozyme n=1 Tax=Lacticaseibacillus salsurae TaxID=3367729 RepID=UPI0038B3AB66